MISLFIFLTLKNATIVWGLENLLRLGPELCHAALPLSRWPDLNRALVCGSSLPAGEPQQLFIDTGLIHLMVVSDSHLVFIEWLLRPLPRWLRMMSLGSYCFFTGFQAPVVRAFIRRCFCDSWRRRFSWTALQIDFATVGVALFLYPEWLMSRSFLMSWMCSLALLLPTVWPQARHFEQAVKTYIFLLPFCWASPISVFWNTVLAPVVGLVLFPTVLATMVAPPLTVVSDQMWDWFLLILKTGPQSTPLELFLASDNLCWLPVVTHIALLILEVKWRRASAFSYSPS